MKAWRIEKHGGPEAVRRVDLPDPVPGPNQVRVRVEAVGLNHMDIWARNGVPGFKFPLPLTPGCDVAGALDSGEKVIVNPGVSCGVCEACLGGFDPLCPSYGMIGEHQDGGCADYIIVPRANVFPRPSGLSATDASALPIPFLTAWTMLVSKAQVRAGDLVLIQAGGSGVSVAAIQIAKLRGATVITTVGSDDKTAKARALGADHVINYKKGPFRDEVKKICTSLGRKGVDVAIDHVGGETFTESLKALAWGGKIVTCGATAGSAVQIDLKPIFFKNISVLGSTMGSKADLIRVAGLVASGKLKPVVDSVFPMAKYLDAVAKLESRDFFGKIVVTN